MMDEAEELRHTVAKAVRAKDLRDSDLWVVDILPHCKNKSAKLQKGILWKPGGQSVSDTGIVAMGCAYNSGANNEVESFMRLLDLWIAQGEEAKPKLEKLELGGKK